MICKSGTAQRDLGDFDAMKGNQTNKVISSQRTDKGSCEKVTLLCLTGAMVPPPPKHGEWYIANLAVSLSCKMACKLADLTKPAS